LNFNILKIKENQEKKQTNPFDQYSLEEKENNLIVKSNINTSDTENKLCTNNDEDVTNINKSEQFNAKSSKRSLINDNESN